jgi:hypothetical protein
MQRTESGIYQLRSTNLMPVPSNIKNTGGREKMVFILNTTLFLNIKIINKENAKYVKNYILHQHWSRDKT